MDDNVKNQKPMPDDSILGFSKDSWTNPWNGDSGSKPKGKLTPAERVQMIENSFEDILGRKADTRDLNYYKYSSLSEEEVRSELLKSKEHKQLLTDGREFENVKKALVSSETKVHMLEAEINDQKASFRELNGLLKEKNNSILELREQLRNPCELRCNTQPTDLSSNEEFKVPVKEEDSFLSKFFDKILSIFNS